MVTDKSAVGVSVSVSVVTKGIPPGGVTVAALTNEPVALGLIVVANVKLTLALTGRFTVVVRAPLPLVGPETLAPPLLAVANQVAALAPVTVLGPVLLTTMV